MSGGGRGNSRNDKTKRIPVYSGRTIAACLIGLWLILGSSVYAGWETGAKAGFDTNVNRETGGGENDHLLSVYVSLDRCPSWEKRKTPAPSAVVLMVQSRRRSPVGPRSKET